MKYIFFGTPNFAAIILKKLIEAGMPPTIVVCNPDRPVGRKKIITPPPAKVLAKKHKIPVWQPEKLSPFGRSPVGGEIDEIDFAVVAAYAKILPKEIINLPRLGMIGVHPSLLPKYRGATPIQSAILNDEQETGVTLFLVDEKVDHGPIIAKRKASLYERSPEGRQIATINYQELEKELAEIGADLLIETLPKFASGEIKPQTQKENEATYTKKFKSEDAFVELKKDDPKLIYRKIRALNPEPGVYTMVNGKRVKLLEADLADSKLKLTKIQIEGKKPTTQTDLL